MDKCSIEKLELIHITTKQNLPSIEKEGLLPDLSEFTIKAHLKHRDIEESDPDWAIEYEEAEDTLPDMVFASSRDQLIASLAMITSKEPLDQISVLGIKPKCNKLFTKQEIASDADYISTEPIPVDCLCELTDWNSHIDPAIYRFLTQ